MPTWTTMSDLVHTQEEDNNNGAQDLFLRHAFKLQNSLFFFFPPFTENRYEKPFCLDNIYSAYCWGHHLMPFPDEPTTDPVMSLPVAPLTYFNFLSRSRPLFKWTR